MMLHDLWNYRHFTKALVKREFQARYSKSLLGSIWVVMNPLYMCILYATIFSSVMHHAVGEFSYTVYVASGLLGWSLFTDILNRSQSIYLDYATMIKKHRFPLLCLPMVVLSLAFIDFFISLALFSIYLLATHQFPGWCFFELLPILLLQAVCAISLGTILGMLNVFFRDTGKAMLVLLQIWFWLTPIVYVADKLPEHLQRYIQYNPLTAMMTAYQTILVKQQSPDWASLWFPLSITLVLVSVLLRFYQKHAEELLDEL